ncbi:hypothetical protein CDAR_588101 [Caerostris darwini]|uniref:Neurotransmitter-gated ion-channel ligand-binding domain-containing protein n=1 Tax=Caerostris darwini TaxID=1538125 RepID=A0AAV4Q182_9ARAC|nr:hypothetical protein CDAR_588101 [Caerostris darwini]
MVHYNLPENNPLRSLQGPHEKRLLTDLLTGYNVLERPVANETEPLLLSFGLTLQQIIDVTFLTWSQLIQFLNTSPDFDANTDQRSNIFASTKCDRKFKLIYRILSGRKYLSVDKRPFYLCEELESSFSQRRVWNLLSSKFVNSEIPHFFRFP